jgi:hypothetical protein
LFLFLFFCNSDLRLVFGALENSPITILI